MTKIETTRLQPNKKVDIQIRNDRLDSYAVIASTVGAYYAVDSFTSSQKTLSKKLARSSGSFLRGFLLCAGAISLFEIIKGVISNKKTS